jgi:ABC-2 type transport system permease protein
MNLWRLEWLRLLRTRSWIALAAVFLFFGLLGPISARYMEEILQRFAGDVTLILPPPTPASGLEQYLGNVLQIGLLVVLAVAAGALGFDQPVERAAFYRSRVRSVWRLLAPRYAVVTLAAIAAFVAGTLGAWYETVILLGDLPAGAMLLGMLLTSLYLAFAVAVAALAASFARGPLVIVTLSVGLLIAVPLLGLVGALRDWLPSNLLGSLVGLVVGVPPVEYLRPALVTIVATAVLLWLAAGRLQRREL